METVFACSLLARGPNAHLLSPSDAYALTHTVFYITDFGARAPKWFGKHAGDTVDLLNACLLRWRVEDNADLVAELLLALECIIYPRSDQAVVSWNYLLSKQSRDGALSGPAGHLNPELFQEEPARRVWAENYHTTVVGALATSLVVRHLRNDSKGKGAPPTFWPLLRSSQNFPGPALPPITRRTAQFALGKHLAWLAHDASCAQPTTAIKNAAVVLRIGFDKTSWEPTLRGLLTRIDADSYSEEDWLQHGLDEVVILMDACSTSGYSSTSFNAFQDQLRLMLTDRWLRLNKGDIPVPALLGLARHGLIDADTRTLQSWRATVDLSKEPVISAKALLQDTWAEQRWLESNASTQLLAESLGATLHEYMRAYDLSTMIVLLRTLVLLGWEHSRIVHDAIRFLVGQTRLSGACGYSRLPEGPVRLDFDRSSTRASALALSEFLVSSDERNP